MGFLDIHHRIEYNNHEVTSIMYKSKKPYIFKTIYLLFSLPVAGFCIYLLCDYLKLGFHGQLVFDDIVNMLTVLLALLFEGAIIGFIVRSYRHPTILMKNLVFKQDGTAFRPGLIITTAGSVLTGAACAAAFYLGFIGGIDKLLSARTLFFIGAMVWIMFHNLLFTVAYFFTFRHEAGTFETI